MKKALVGLKGYFSEIDQLHATNLNKSALSAQAALFANGSDLLKDRVKANLTQIDGYQKQLDKLVGTLGSAGNLQDTFAISAGILPAAPDVPSNTDPKTPIEADYWTSITVDASSNYSAEQSSSSSNSYSVGGGASWGLFSIGGSVSHSDATADAAKQMANLRVKASFDCMRVDITRSWLRSELFYDGDLRVAAGN